MIGGSFRPMRAAQVGLVLCVFLTGSATCALAQGTAAAVDLPATGFVPPAAASADVASDCQDDWPTDRERPKLIERFPKRGTSGHVSRLELEIEHLPGEVVFPAGLEAMLLMSG